jgi:hypothetical protein
MRNYFATLEIRVETIKIFHTCNDRIFLLLHPITFPKHSTDYRLKAEFCTRTVRRKTTDGQ